ncbi:MAG TPA: hypothetical protein VLX92_01385 [Kofleriaceae bacterium]|nr:hypothetical protein [Kofleriaceae bacterium]
MTRALAIALVLAAAGGAAAQPGSGSAGSGSARIIQLPMDAEAPEVSAAASPSDVRLGARFTLFVRAVYGPGVEVNLPAVIELGDAFEIARRATSDRPRADGKRVREWQLELYAWELGDLDVPPVRVTFTAGGRAGQVETNPVPVRVTGVLGDVDDPKLMKGDTPPVALTMRTWLWVWIAGGGAVVIAAAIAVVVARRRRRRVVRLVGSLGPAPRRIDMTSERALERLLAIERSGVLARDAERKAGYADMVDVVREYVGARYRVATLDLTTAELGRVLARCAPEPERLRIEAWLERCDLVKYGGFRATAGEAGGVLADARGLVVATTAEAA